jgi:hypothetical protein
MLASAHPVPLEQLLSSTALSFGHNVTVIAYAALGMTILSEEPFEAILEGFLVPLLPDTNMALRVESNDYVPEYVLPILDRRFAEVVQEACNVYSTAEGPYDYTFPVVLTGKLVPLYEPDAPQVKAALDNLVSGIVLVDPFSSNKKEIYLDF